MSLLLLVRHGQAALGAYTGGSGELTELGRTQASLTGSALAARGLWADRIVSGTPARQRETGELVRAACGPDVPEIEVDERWDEYDGTTLLAAYPATEAGPGAGESKARFFQQVLDDSL